MGPANRLCNPQSVFATLQGIFKLLLKVIQRLIGLHRFST
jgi:hypothetical protein